MLRRIAKIASGLVVGLCALAAGAGADRSATSGGCVWQSGDRIAVRGLLRGDVNGDGRADTVAVVARAHAPKGCHFALRVRLARGAVLYARLADSAPRGTPPLSQGWPNLIALARVDTRPGAEAVVTVGAGASTAFSSLFSVRDGRLVRLQAPWDAFGVGASSVANGVDCWHGPASGEVVSSFAQANESGWAGHPRHLPTRWECL